MYLENLGQNPNRLGHPHVESSRAGEGLGVPIREERSTARGREVGDFQLNVSPAVFEEHPRAVDIDW
jgi:hypothetical protein